jgi:CO dehydrogenase/acetyl-CoA synthase delta subunit
MSLLIAGTELIIMYHPKAVEVVKKKVSELYDSEEGK